MREATLSVNTEIQAVVQQLLVEDARFDEQERRSLHRETLVRPVTIALRESDEVLGGICRNISVMGLCALTRKQIAEKEVAKICIHSLESDTKTFLVECRWSRRFGDGWFMSGWHFINLVKRR